MIAATSYTWVLVLMSAGGLDHIPGYHSKDICNEVAAMVREQTWVKAYCIPGPEWTGEVLPPSNTSLELQ